MIARMKSAKVGARYQIVIPKVVRERLRVRPGDRVEVRVKGDHIEVWPEHPDPARKWAGSLHGTWGKGFDPVAHVRKLRDEWAEREGQQAALRRPARRRSE